MPAKSPLYDRELFAWSRQQADVSPAGKPTEADIEHIAQEIESMGRAERRERTESGSSPARSARSPRLRARKGRTAWAAAEKSA